MKQSRAVETLDVFMEQYEAHLRSAVLSRPDEYGYGPDEVPTVAARMRAAIERNSYNKDSRALRATCRALGIKHTYTAIRKHLVLS